MRHWIEYRHWVEYIGAWAVLKLLGLLPRPAAHQLATLPARLFYWATPRLRQTADKNLAMALPELSATERSSLCWGTYRSLGRLLAEFAQFPRLNPENVRLVVAYEGLENYQAAIRLCCFHQQSVAEALIYDRTKALGDRHLLTDTDRFYPLLILTVSTPQSRH